MHRKIILYLGTALLLVMQGGISAAGSTLIPPEAVLERMERRYARQMSSLESYQANREYAASNALLKKPAAWKIRERYQSPGQRTLRVVERHAPGVLDRLLLAPLIEAETETARATVRPGVDITRANYQFSFVRHDSQRSAYVFRLEPRTTNRYLFRGLIWIDAEDFAVKRIEGSPAQKPSVWVRENRFIHEFAKFGEMWFPVHHRSEAQIRMFGTATLEISYSDYQWQQQH